jgi:hypothetical protein
MVAEMLVQQWPAHVHQPHVNEWLFRLAHEAKLRRRWLVKLRRFWGVHYRKLGSRNHLSPADQRRKVRRKKPTSESISGTSFDPHIWGSKWSYTGHRCNTKTVLMVPDVGSESDPQFWGQELVPKYDSERSGQADVTVVKMASHLRI